MFGKRSDEPRTAQDRARAAAERAARRAGRPLPPEAFEDTLRPPDVEPLPPLGEPAPPVHDEVAPPIEPDTPAPPADFAPPPAAPRHDAPPPAAVRDDTPPPAARDDDAPPPAAVRDDAPPPAAQHDDAPPPAAQHDDAPPPAAQHDDAPPPAAQHDDAPPPAAQHDDAPPTAPHDEVAPAVEPLADVTPPAPQGEAPPAAPLDDEAPPAAPLDGEVPPPVPLADAPHDGDAPPPEPLADAPRADAAPPSDPVGEAPGPPRRPEAFHDPQPTVEYTPFQTEEHHVAGGDAPLGRPRDDEPRLVAARGIKREDADDIHAYATTRGDTSEHATDDGTGEARALETGEHRAFDETEVRPPVPLRRAPTRSPADAPRRRPAPNAPRKRLAASRRNRPTGEGHWGRRIGAVVALIVLAAVLYVINATFQPFHGDGSGRVVVNIPAGADAGKIGDQLEAAGVIDSARFFELKATISGERGDLRPGRYVLKQGMTNGAVIDALTNVPENKQAAATVDVTIVEGPSRRENAAVVDRSKKVEGSYASASGSKATLARIRKLGAPKGTKSAEGFLFPATYKLEEGSSANELVEQQLDAFESNFAKVDMRAAKRKNLSRYDVLIIASMIEREVQLPRERALVSAVIYNRLKQGMPLAIDATIRYYTNNWKRPILQSELDKQEPYNTRLNRGLPPTPIGNPGLASIKAAAKPSSKSYLFYVRKPGKSGEHAFSSTDAQFERDRQRYEAAREG